jgi:PKD repeat protein
MTTLTTGSPATNVYVVSIPDVYQLWSLFHNNWWARFIWSAGGVCQSLLANPTSTQTVDVQRRAAVRQRNIDYNTQLQQVCVLFARCRFDGNAAFNTQFTTSDVSGDYFHPSIAGQAKLASVTWTAGYAWTVSPPPNVAPTAAFTSSCSGLTCAFTDASTDSDGTIASWSWDFGDVSALSTATNPTHTYGADGTYNVTLTVTDNDGATGSVSAGVTVAAAPAPTPMWVSAITKSAVTSRSGWTATVTVSVVDASGPVSGVAVTGSWSAGTGATSCTTDGSGVCSMTATLGKKTTTVRFTVGNLTKAGWTYDSSKGVTFIDVARP